MKKQMFAFLALALLLAAFLPAGENPVALEINLFQGYRPGVSEPATPPLVVYLPPDAGWSGDVERQRQQLVDSLGLEGVSVLSVRRLTVPYGGDATVRAETRPTPYTITVRPVRNLPGSVELDVRIAEGKEDGRELASASVSGELGRTVILGGKPGSNPVFVAVTPRAPSAEGKSEGPYTADGDIVPPRLVHRVDPEYPAELRKEKKTGLVVIQATVAADGSVVRAAVVRHSDPGLDQSALDAVRQWHYEPATLKGRPVQVYLTITVNFRLD